MRDYTPSKQLNSKLSLDTHKRINTLIKEHGYQTQRQVIESAVESLFNSVTLSETEEVEKQAEKQPKEKPQTTKPPSSKFQAGDLCSDKGKGSICKDTYNRAGHHPECPKFPAAQ